MSYIVNFFIATYNLIIFLPYFFSIPILLKTLFSPWKGMNATRTKRGFSMEDFMQTLLFNLISRVIGFLLRMFIILVYIFCQIIYLLIIPFLFVLYIIFWPLAIIFSIFAESEVHKKDRIKKEFLKVRMLDKKNESAVLNWFEHYYNAYCLHLPWWHSKSLFSVTPIAKDWSLGYTPTLDSYTQDIEQGQHYQKHLVGRRKEIKQIEQALSSHKDANVIIVGDAGVGKHTIIGAIAGQIAQANAPKDLLYRRLVRLNMDRILNKYTDSIQRKKFLSELLKEAMESKSIILVIEDFDKYISNEKDKIDLSSTFEYYGKSPNLKLIAITTPFFYQKYVSNNGAIRNLFTKVDVVEASKADTTKIILENIDVYERINKIIIPFESVVEIVEKSDYYITNVPFPEKALKLLDDVCIFCSQSVKAKVLLPAMVDRVLSEEIHMPITVNSDMKTKLLSLEKTLLKEIVDQKYGIKEISVGLRRAFLLLGKRKKPLASFIFLGPTGVGKTETAKVISRIFFDSEKYLIRFDMSAYQTKDDIEKLIGSVKLNYPGLLTVAINQNPYGVLLLDEIEKANKDLLNIFLTILDEGYFTDGFGRKVNCKNLVVVATSNAGADIIYKQIDQAHVHDNYTPLTSVYSQILNEYLINNHIFSPEFLNRFDGIIIFQKLSYHSIFKIAKRIIVEIKNNVFRTYKITPELSDETLKKIIRANYDPTFGARDIGRIINQKVEDKIAKIVLGGKFKEGDIIKL